jgi:hypothetical protein
MNTAIYKVINVQIEIYHVLCLVGMSMMMVLHFLVFDVVPKYLLRSTVLIINDIDVN